MRAFLAKYLPVSERKTALWLVVGGTLIVLLASDLGRRVMSEMTASAMPAGAGYAVQGLTEFALVTILVAGLIRFAGAPRVIALYLLLGQLVSVGVAVMGVPAVLVSASRESGGDSGMLWSLAASAALSLSIGLGAIAGAWVASTVSLARIQDEGFSGDDPDGDGLHRKPASSGWRFMGWEGRPLAGSALVAVALVAATVIPSAANVLSGLVSALVPSQMPDGSLSGTTVVMWQIIGTLSWPLSTWLVTARLGVASAWVAAVATLLASLVYAVEATFGGGVATLVYSLAVSVAPHVITVAAALLGTALALRREPATLD